LNCDAQSWARLSWRSKHRADVVMSLTLMHVEKMYCNWTLEHEISQVALLSRFVSPSPPSEFQLDGSHQAAICPTFRERLKYYLGQNSGPSVRWWWPSLQSRDSFSESCDCVFTHIRREKSRWPRSKIKHGFLCFIQFLSAVFFLVTSRTNFITTMESHLFSQYEKTFLFFRQETRFVVDIYVTAVRVFVICLV
jgi:hypothetical protein